MSRKKAKTPAEIAAELEAARERIARERAAARAACKDPAQWGADARALRAQPDVEVIMETKTKVQTAKRSDVFSRVLLLTDRSAADQERLTASLAAVRRLEHDVALRAGVTGGGFGIHVDQGRPIPISDVSLLAGDRIKAVLALVGRRDAALLAELIEPRQVMTSDEQERWRQVVVMFTGETLPHAQSSAVRGACDNLARAYWEIDQAPRAKAA